jgi:polyphosphate kinase 2 (PPK2 family)
MNRKPSRWLVVTLAGGALLVGCGSSNSSTTSSQTTSIATNAVSPAAAQQAATSCKHAIQSQTKLTTSEKAKLEVLCGKAAGGKGANLSQVAHEVCVELVNVSHVPAGADRERALALCKLQ